MGLVKDTGCFKKLIQYSRADSSLQNKKRKNPYKLCQQLVISSIACDLNRWDFYMWSHLQQLDNAIDISDEKGLHACVMKAFETVRHLVGVTEVCHHVLQKGRIFGTEKSIPKVLKSIFETLCIFRSYTTAWSLRCHGLMILPNAYWISLCMKIQVHTSMQTSRKR